MKRRRHIQVFEHNALKVGDKVRDVGDKAFVLFTESDRKALEDYYGEGIPFFSLIHRGVKFNEHVGVLQTSSLTIEVLPKADNETNDKASWQKFLITMLRATGIIPEPTGTAELKLKGNSVLDLYMQLFLSEVRYLLQRGLIRKYRPIEGNVSALKGSLRFTQNIRHNIVHAERFYVRYTTYDRDNVYNAILLKCIDLVSRSSNVVEISALAASLQLDFPECGDIKISEAIFNRLQFDRKTESYRKALAMAKLLLLRYHPDVQRGANEVLALMFNMNDLWEKYVYKSLNKEVNRRKLPYLLKAQVRNTFWKPAGGYMRTIRPDIVVYRASDLKSANVVLDTKWKRITLAQPDDADIKQMLAYNLYNNCSRSALVYPNCGLVPQAEGVYQVKGHGKCALLFIALDRDEQLGMKLDLENLIQWIEKENNDDAGA